MQKKRNLVFVLAASASALAFGAAAQSAHAQDDPGLPLVLSADDDKEESAASESAEEAPEEPAAPAPEEPAAEDPETLPAPAVVADSQRAAEDEIPLELPAESEALDQEVVVPEGELTEEQMIQLSNQPLFHEFTNAIGEVAPMPEDVDVESLNVPGATLVSPVRPVVTPTVVNTQPEVSVEEATNQLDQVLELAEVDLSTLELSDKDKHAIAQLDAEIKRLCPLWIDAEVNRTTIGRRELNWKQKGAPLYSIVDPKPLDVQGSDWAMAPDAPFFFQVSDSATGETFYTKAGDFEQIDPQNLISPALVRDDKTYALTVEPGKVAPTGRAVRIRVQHTGQVQGVDAGGKIVTDVNLANVPLFMFDNPTRLQSEDGVFFTPTPASGEPRQVQIAPGSKSGVTSGKVLPSNGKPEEIFARIALLCKSKKRLVEILSQPSIN